MRWATPASPCRPVYARARMRACVRSRSRADVVSFVCLCFVVGKRVHERVHSGACACVQSGACASCLCLDLHVVQGAIAVTVEQLEKFRDLVGQVLSVKMGQALRSAARSLINCLCLGANRVKGAD